MALIALSVILPIALLIAYGIYKKLLEKENRYALAIAVFSFIVSALGITLLAGFTFMYFIGFGR
jgi:hypothetical protein